MAITLSAICNTLTAQEKSIEVSVDVESVDGKEQRNFTVTIGDGSNEKEIVWKDNGEIPAAIKTQLEKEGVDIKMLEGDGAVEVSVEDSSNKKIHKEVEIIKIHSDDNEGHHKQDSELEIAKNGDVMIIKLKDGDDIPDDVRKILEEHDIDIEKLKKEGMHEGHKKEMKMMQKKVIKIKSKNDDGNETIMEWEGDGEAPAEIQRLLEEEGIDLDDEDHKMIFIGDGDQQKIKIDSKATKQYRIKTIDEDGNERVIEWNGEGDMPEEMKKHQDMFQGKKRKTQTSNGNRAQLGIMIEENDEVKGVRVINVVKGSPAEAVGFKEGYNITGVNNKEVNKIDDLLSALKPFKPGSTVNIKFLDGDKASNVNVTLGGSSQRSNVYIFKDAMEGDQFNMFKKVEKCDENTTVTTIKVEKHIESEESVDTQTEKRTIPEGRQLKLKSFTAFPNPTANSVNISFTGNNNPTVVQLTDITGKEIFKEVVDNFDGSYSKDVDLSNYASGQYILYVIQNQKIFTESIILQ